jgi:hypothetical protein
MGLNWSDGRGRPPLHNQFDVTTVDRLNEGETMSIWTILFIILLIAWIGGFTVFHVASGLIHLLLVFAVISLILHFVLGTRAA